MSPIPQLQHRGLRGLLQDFASPIRLFPLVRCTLATRRTRESNPDTGGIEPLAHTSGDRRHGQGVHGEFVLSAGFEPASRAFRRISLHSPKLCQLSYDSIYKGAKRPRKIFQKAPQRRKEERPPGCRRRIISSATPIPYHIFRNLSTPPRLLSTSYATTPRLHRAYRATPLQYHPGYPPTPALLLR